MHLDPYSTCTFLFRPWPAVLGGFVNLLSTSNIVEGLPLHAQFHVAVNVRFPALVMAW